MPNLNAAIQLAAHEAIAAEAAALEERLEAAEERAFFFEQRLEDLEENFWFELQVGPSEGHTQNHHMNHPPHRAPSLGVLC